MIKNSFVAFMFAFAYFVSASAINAQDAPYVDQGPGTNSLEQSDTTSTSRGSTNWTWVIPIIGIGLPLLLIALYRNNVTEYPYDTPYAGVKGGRAKREREEIDLDDDLL